MSDVGSSNWSETAASNNAAVPNGWPENMAPSGVNDAAREDHAALKRWWNRINGVKTTGGTANAQTATYDVAEAAYYTGAIHTVIIGSGLTNTSAAALNISSLGAVTILTSGGSALRGGEMPANFPAMLLHNGTNQLLLNERNAYGSVTPTIALGSGTVAYSVQVGGWHRKGSWVDLWGAITITGSTTPSGALTITNTGAPASESVTGQEWQVPLVPAVGSATFLLGSTDSSFVAAIGAGTSTVTIVKLNHATGATGSAGSAVASTTASIVFQARYRTTAA